MSPAGYWPQLRAAVEAGADSVYFGLKHFSARAKVGFDLSELPEVMRTLHKRGVRGFLTFNTLIFENEIEEAAKTIAAIAEAGTDALIVQDLGITKLAHEIAPDLELHASTQMSITNAEGVEFARNFGVSRVTLARELSLKEIRAILAETDCELEMFVHGALCVAYSGQCFSSEAWGGRSANRGQCAQACRLPYQMLVDGEIEPLADARYLLSPGDLCTIEQIPEIVQMGMSALKIEGRYKDADYVALTTRAYRKAVDDAWEGRASSATPEEQLLLEQVYSRGLGAFFVNGTNHQTVVNGRAPRHRGVLMGRVITIEADRAIVEPSETHAIAPLKAGDGVVFDAADWRSPEEPEEGGRVYEVIANRNRTVSLLFGNNSIRFSRVRPGDLVWRTDTPETSRAARPFTEAIAPVHRQPVNVQVIARPGEPLVTRWSLARHTGARNPDSVITVRSPESLVEAQSRAISIDSLRLQLGRLGNTPYELAGLDIDLHGSPFVPASILNQIRREAVERLQSFQSAPRTVPVFTPAARTTKTVSAAPRQQTPEIHLLVRTPGQLEAAIALQPASITLDYLDLYGLRPSVQYVKDRDVEVRVASPRVLKPGEARIVNFLHSLECPILVRASGILHVLKTYPHRELVGDFSLNTANSLTAEMFLALGLSRITPTYDLNAAQIPALAAAIGPEYIEVVAFQHLPVFHTEHCVFCRFLSNGTSYLDCGRPCESHRVALQDQSGRAHPVIADVGCRNTVFGAEAQEASGHLLNWLRSGIRHFRLEFVHESGEQVEQVVTAFSAALQGSISYSVLGQRLKSISPYGTTQGSFFIPSSELVLPILR
jgi:putative protease